MRAPHLGDVVAAARALRAVPGRQRAELLRVLMCEAGAAQRHGRATGTNHPDFGDGSLMGAALRHPCVREPELGDRDYCRCLAMVLLAIGRRRGGGAPDLLVVPLRKVLT